MRLNTPRVMPLAETDMAPDLLALLGPRFKAIPVLNIFARWLTRPRLSSASWRGGYILSDANSLSPRDRELVILRTGYNWKSGYEWAARADRSGLRADRAGDRADQAGPTDPAWSDQDRALLQATDELTADAFITNATWTALGGFSEKQRMDLVMTVAQYTQVSMMLNSFGVQLDEDLTLDNDLVVQHD